MKPAVDITGRRFTRLTALHPTECPVKHCSYSYRRVMWWWCRCDCGKELPCNGVMLRRGNKRSCGCLRRDIGLQRVGLLAGTRTKYAAELAEYRRRYGPLEGFDERSSAG